MVFFAVGFETTAPGNAMAVWQAQQLGLSNFSILCSHVLVPPAMEALLGSPGNTVQGFLAAGHVCAVMGYWEYEPMAERYRVPIVVTGFEPLDLLQGIYMTVQGAGGGAYGRREPVQPGRHARGQPAGPAAIGAGLRGVAIASGAASARSRRVAIACAPSSPPLMPSSASTWPISWRRSRRCASPGRSCRA